MMHAMRSALRLTELFARHRGAARHWAAQRVSAILLLFLGLWFAISLLFLASAPHSAWVRFVDNPFNALMLLGLFACLHHHGALGLDEVLLDYVHDDSARKSWSRRLRIMLGASFAISTLSLLLLVLQS